MSQNQPVANDIKLCSVVEINDQIGHPQSLNGRWQFAYRPEPKPESVPPPDDQYQMTIPVPGFWDDSCSVENPPPWWSSARFNPDYAPLRFARARGADTHVSSPDGSLPWLTGTGFYRRRFSLAGDALKRDWLVTVETMFLNAEAWLNGHLLAAHRGYAARFEIWLPQTHLNLGENELVIAVTNLDSSQGGLRLRGFKGRGGGIGPIRLRAHAGGRIAGFQVHLTPELNEVEMDIDLESPPEVRPPDDNRMTWRLLDLTGRELKTGSRTGLRPGRVKTRFNRDSLTAWSPCQPQLYDLELTWTGDDREVDRQRFRVGLRRLDSRRLKIQLNGQPLYLRGATEHCYFPATCTPPFDRSYYRQIITRLKDIGFNWLRCHTWVPPEEYLDAADELGMLVQVELPPGLKEPEWDGIVRRCRRHPSVGFYCGGNEQMCDFSAIEFWGRLRETVRQLAPGTLFMPQEAMRGIEYYWSDSKVEEGSLTEEPFRHHPARLERITAIADVFGQYSWGYLSYLSLQQHWRDLERCYTVYQRPLLSHEIGILDSYLDPGLRERYRGTRIGTGLYDLAAAQLAAAGVLERWPLYYRNSCRWQAALRKHVIEKARLCERINGYDYLGATHTHWHRSGYGCGCLNEFYEFKAGDRAADFLACNGASVLLLDHHDRFCHYSGDQFSADLFAAWYDSADPGGTTVAWSLIDQDNAVIREGIMPGQPVRKGRLTRLGTLAFEWPGLETAAAVRLRVELTGTKVVNHWPFWLFPPGPADNWPSQVRVVEELTGPVISFLEQGGDVVLLGHRPLPVRPTSFQINVAGRSGAHTATVVADHPALAGFPHQGWCDWQFCELLENGRAVQLHELTEAFDPIVETAGSYKQPGREAALFEARVGAGRLLAAAFNPAADGPAARHLRQCLSRYVGSDEFNPGMEIKAAALQRSAADKSETESGPVTDMAFDVNLRQPQRPGADRS